MKDYKLIESIANELNCSTRTVRRNLNKIGKDKYSKLIDGRLHVHSGYFKAIENVETKGFVLYNANADIYHHEPEHTFDQVKCYLKQNGYKVLFNYKTMTSDEYWDFIHKERAKTYKCKSIEIEMEKISIDSNYSRQVVRKMSVDGHEITNFELAGFYGRILLDYANSLYSESDQSKIDYKNHLQRKKETKDTYVYLMIDKNTGYHKIGRSKDPKYREKTLQSEKPTIELLYKFKAHSSTEKELHKKYNSKRIRGEWFDLNQKDIDYIKTL